jgi:hypothetical protein
MLNAYINILQTLVPLYLVMLLGYAAGAFRLCAHDRVSPLSRVSPTPGRAQVALRWRTISCWTA